MGGSDEGLLGFDCIRPLKPHLGASYQRLTGLLQAAIAARYDVPAWRQEDYLLHKRADPLAAISETAHVAGWSVAAIHEEFGTTTKRCESPKLRHESNLIRQGSRGARKSQGARQEHDLER